MTKKEKRAFDAMLDALQTLLMELTGGFNHDAVAAEAYNQRHLDEAVLDGEMATSLAFKANEERLGGLE
jgi:hypothetical protein|tara:strand:+ start:74 stop:280 length:207 start_codon:yes stop_codon:yes gene_type:complete